MDLNFQHDSKNKVFSAEIKGEKIELHYNSIDENTLDYYHTFVPDTLRNQGMGAKIVKYALEYAMENNLKIKPSCPFVQSYIELHQQYRALINN